MGLAISSASWRALKVHLAGVRGDRAQLLELWERYLSGESGGEIWHAFVDAAGRLRLDDSRVISHLIRVVEGSVFFGPRFSAMWALGRIGAPAGAAAADAIETHIYDSDPVVAGLRRRSVQRIRGRDEQWQECPTCQGGRARGANGRPIRDACFDCFGLELVLRDRSETAPSDQIQ